MTRKKTKKRSYAYQVKWILMWYIGTHKSEKSYCVLNMKLSASSLQAHLKFVMAVLGQKQKNELSERKHTQKRQIGEKVFGHNWPMFGELDWE